MLPGAGPTAFTLLRSRAGSATLTGGRLEAKSHQSLLLRCARVKRGVCSSFRLRIAADRKVPESFTSGPLPPGSGSALLRGSDGFCLVITEIGQSSPKAYPTGFHVGFTADSAEQVYAKHHELTEAGCLPEPVKTFEAMGKSWTTFYCPVGYGIKIEVNPQSEDWKSHRRTFAAGDVPLSFPSKRLRCSK